jgi:integrase/recombinase XerD
VSRPASPAAATGRPRPMASPAAPGRPRPKSAGADGQPDDAPADLLQHLLDEHAAWLTAERGLSANTLAAYGRDLRAYAAFLRARGLGDPARVGEDDVRDFAASLTGRLGPASIARTLAAVRSVHRFAVAEGIVARDPAHEVDGPRVPDGVPKALSEADVGALLAAPVGSGPLTIRDRAILEVLYGTGVRISELVGLDTPDVEREAAFLRVVGKGDKERVVPLGRYALRALDAYLDDARPALVARRRASGRRVDHQAVFVNARGGRLTRQGAWTVIVGHAQRVGLHDRVWPHVLRHSCATHMLEHGADLRVVQELLGHARISTTQRYTRVTVERLRAVVDAAHPRARA